RNSDAGQTPSGTPTFNRVLNSPPVYIGPFEGPSRDLTSSAIPPLTRRRSLMPEPRGRTDKGRANRVRLDVPVQLWEHGASYTGLAKNIGPGGIFVATVRSLGVGDRVIVILNVKGDAGP